MELTYRPVKETCKRKACTDGMIATFWPVEDKHVFPKKSSSEA